MNKVSVVIPIYNTELYLEKCLESVVNQTEPFFEIILVDDGSIDRSREIYDKYCREYSNIMLILQKNKGPGAARNVGKSNATGDYIVFVDSDDYVSRDMNRKIMNVLFTDEVDILYYDADIQYDIDTEIPLDTFKNKNILDEQVMTGMEYLKGTFSNYYVISPVMAVYKREFLDKREIYFPEGIYYEDIYFCLQTVTLAEKVKHMSDSLYVRRCRKNSIMTGGIDAKKCHDLVINQKLMWSFLFENKCWYTQSTLLKKFIAFFLLNAISHIFQCQDKGIIETQERILIEGFLEKCLFLFIEKELTWGESLAFVFILCKTHEISNNSEDNLIKKYFGTFNRYKMCLERTKVCLKEGFLQKIYSLPLNNGRVKVGIYGIGKHTMALLRLYSKYVDEIKCNLSFIVTSCDAKIDFFNRSVITYTEIPKEIDCIILSSRQYENDMEKNLLNRGVNKNKIRSFYDKNDICDLIMVECVMNQIFKRDKKSVKEMFCK